VQFRDQRARDALDAAQCDLASVEARLEEVSRDLGGLSEEDAVERLEQATAALTEAERAHEAAAILTGELSDLDDRIEEEGERRRRDIQARASLETEIRTASLAIDASRARIAPELPGRGSRFAAGQIRRVLLSNPQIAARMLNGYAIVSRMDSARKALVKTELEALIAVENISIDVREVLERLQRGLT